jgi:hypothetical protein
MYLKYYVFEQWAVVFIMTSHHDLRVYQIKITASTLETHISELNSFLSQTTQDSYLIKEAGGRLYQHLIEPFESLLADCHRIFIQPNGPFSYLHFGVLRNKQAKNLAERVEIALTLPTQAPAFSSSSLNESFVFYAVGTEKMAQGICNMLSPLLLGQDGFHQIDYTSSIHFLNPLSPHSQQSNSPTRPSQVHTLYLFGHPINDHLFRFQDDQRPVPLGDLIQLVSRLNPVCLVIDQTMDRSMNRTSIQALLTAVQGGVLVRHNRHIYDDAFLAEFFGRATQTHNPLGLVEALSYARRKAITERQTPLGWGSFELYIVEQMS